MSTSFNERLNALIDAKVAEAIADILEGNGEPQTPKGRATDDNGAAERPDMGTRRSKKRGRGRAQVAYSLVPVKKGHRRVAPKLHRTAQMVWEFIKENGPSTAADIETGTDLGKKTVESSVWFLRNSGHVVSKPITD